LPHTHTDDNLRVDNRKIHHNGEKENQQKEALEKLDRDKRMTKILTEKPTRNDFKFSSK